MKDPEIRKILIEYIKATEDEVRIYQEKSIGNSICDVMAVTDRLTGYEIKSDADNYERLGSQIDAYNKFFDRNYIVVSSAHIKQIKEHVPPFWGIIFIQNDGLLVWRNPKDNPNVSRKKQLSILWKLELKNLLVKNGMPAFAQRDKAYIAKQIASTVPREKLRAQIAEELMKRDYSVYDAKDYTIHQERLLNLPLPTEEMIDTLSEQNLDKLTLDEWINIYNQAKHVREQKNTIYQKERLTPVEHEIKYTDIAVSLGAPWINEDIINEFAWHLILDDPKLEPNYFGKKIVFHESITGNWHVSEKRAYGFGRENTNTESVFGTQRFNALCILEASLNLREIKIYDGTKYNEKETIAALEKQQVIEAEFRRWIWEDEDRRFIIEEEYNRLFAGYKKTEYDGSELVFPEMNPEFGLFDYQKDAVQKIISTKNTLLAFDVGAGKTYIMIAAAMKMRQEGISRKNLFVVPNNIVGQWEKIFSDLYPKAKILAIEPKSFKPEMRAKVTKQMKEADYDGIIIAYSCFEMIPLSENYIKNEYMEFSRKIDTAIRDEFSKYTYNREIRNGVKPLEDLKKYIRKLTDILLEASEPEPEAITFDELEINTIFLDEAHNYKNIPIRTHLKNLTGINTKGSMKCLDMMKKIRCVQDFNNGRGAVLATGTPLCNSISDAYTMQMYLQPEDMARTHLETFDNWVKTFAKPEQLCEIDVDTSKYRMITRFAEFHNLPELSRMLSEVSIFHAMENEEGMPLLDEYTNIEIPKSDTLDAYMHDLCDRTDRIRSKKVNRKTDNMLKVSTDGRKAALSLKLVGKEEKYDKYSKIYNCAENVIKVYDTFPGCSQLIFCDYSTPKGEDFSVYKDLKEHLVKEGIPENEIAFVHSYKTEMRKLMLYREVNEGTIRILIGSTFKLGIGANVQTKLKAIHHLDIPWRPADMVQREGRILRRGNTNDEIEIYRYITKGSFDAYAWQVLETKQNFISQFLKGSTYQRSASDLESNVLSYGEVKAIAIGNDSMKTLAEKENLLKKLTILNLKFEENNAQLKEELEELSITIPLLQGKIRNAEYNRKQIEKTTSEEKEKLLKQHSDLLTKEVLYKETDLPKTQIICFNLKLPKEQSETKPTIILESYGYEYPIEMGDSPSGNIRRIMNFLVRYSKTISELEEKLAHDTERKKQIEDLLQNTQTNPYTEQIRECEEIISALKASIK